MSNKGWKKLENEAGYPCYVDETTGKQQYDHPEFIKLMESLSVYDDMKYSVYRIAFKINALQKQLKVPPLRISSGVFARHQLSLSESSLSLDTTELEAVLADIYFAAEKDGLFEGDVDLTVDLLINLLLNVYDADRKQPIRVLAAKTLLIILSNEPASDKWFALANSCADHNGCVSAKRLSALLTHVAALPLYCGTSTGQLQDDVVACFDKNSGMLGVNSRAVAEWGVQNCASTRWLSVLQRISASVDDDKSVGICAVCSQNLKKMLKFKCSKCNEVYFCEKCYLYDRGLTSINGHKKNHIVQEIIDGQIKSSECLSFMKSMRRFFFCTKTKKKVVKCKKTDKVDGTGTIKRRKGNKPTIFTSTVGKASGKEAGNPTHMLQDIITQLEAQNRALQELSTQLKVTGSNDDELKSKVDTHWTQISTQINRLKILKDNLAAPQNIPQEDHKERPQAFDLFSPIPITEIQSKVTDKNQPRVLSLDSGNFSVISKQGSQLLTVSGDALKPVVHTTSDSISAVSVNDISSWYNETQATDKRIRQAKRQPTADIQHLSADDKFAADIRSVENSNDKMKELNADLDTVLDRLQQILTHNFAMDDSCFDNTQLRETASEMEGLLGTLIRGVEQRATLNNTKGLV